MLYSHNSLLYIVYFLCKSWCLQDFLWIKCKCIFARSCWMDTGNSIWFLGILVIVVMVVNLIFVVNVIRVIKRKRTLEGQAGQHGATTMKAARAALMLVPILGLHFILLPIRPSQGSILEYIYEVVSAVSSNFQGFLVSLLFCFLNSEVKVIFPLFLPTFHN